ncbi:gliding motility-associated C-terminal domain-containing protein [Candidatus Latescibacterota bacterium]
MKKIFLLLICILGLLLTFRLLLADEEEISKIHELTIGLGANDLGELVWDGETLWIEGSGSLVNLVGEGHKVSDWLTYKEMDGFGNGSMSALFASGDTLIAAWVYNAPYNDSYAPIGDGISISFDKGNSWRHIPILEMFPERDIPEIKVPGRYTSIYDITLSDLVIWCSTTAGFLLKSENLGNSWTKILPNDEEFSFQNPNHHGQCLDVYGDTLWVGTFQGMNVSVDRGERWTNFSWPEDGSGDPEVDQWPGNFPVAVEHKVVGGKTHVWVASHDYFGFGRIGICHTSDNGTTWEYKKYLDYNSRPWNIAFGHSGASNPAISDSTVFAATNAGLIVSYDLGENWKTLHIRESNNLYWDDDSPVSSVLVVGDTLWVTSSDGVARTTDWGESWEIFKGVTRVMTLDTGNQNIGISSEFDYLEGNLKTYAFPNPFSPKRQHKDYSRTRIQYAIENDAQVTVKIYNFSGRLIRELIKNEHRSGGRDYQEIWDGRDGNNSIVPNGVYFYIINTNKGDSARGKIMVLD